MLRGFLTVCLLFVLAGCASPGSRTERAEERAAAAGLVRWDISAPPFVLATFSRLTDPAAPVHVYIEGDGLAWLSRREPSLNPTPGDPVGLDLALRDPAPNVVYVARPCQFVPLKTPGNHCSVRDWTSDRFSSRVMAAYQSALDQISDDPPPERGRCHRAEAQAKAGDGGGDFTCNNNVTPSGFAFGSPTSPFQGEDKHKFDLIGYSGGGYIALVLASTRPDILSVRTVAGDLDNAAFTALHRVSDMPATVPLDPAMRARLAHIPQRHFVGGDDTQVPAVIAQSYLSSLPQKTCVVLDVLAGATHEDGWVDNWPALLQRDVACRP